MSRGFYTKSKKPHCKTEPVKRRKVSRKNRASPPPSVPEDLNATSRTIYGLTSTREAESIEDPLEDWPESTGEADEWLIERGAPDEPEG